MPKDGALNGILYFLIGIPLAILSLTLLTKLFDKLTKRKKSMNS